MNRHDEEKNFLNQINKKLDQRVGTIDDATLDALRNIRKSAITEAADRSENIFTRFQLYPMVVATAALVLVVSVTLKINMNSAVDDIPGLEDIPLMSASDDIDLYRDLEFYQWLEAEKVNG